MARGSEFDTAIGARLAEIRAKRGYTLAEVAQRAGFGSPETVSKIEANAGYRRGKRAGTPTNARSVTVRDVVALAYALDVSPVALLLPADESEPVTLVPDKVNPVVVSAGFVRFWFTRGPLVGEHDTDEEVAEKSRRYFEEATEWDRRYHEVFRDRAITALQELRGYLTIAITGDHPKVSDVDLADRISRTMKRLATHASAIEQDLREETSDGQD